MLNIGLGEMLVIAIIALLVFGPERLPEIARQAAQFMNQIRGVTDEIQRTLLDETKPIRQSFEETKREIESTANPIKEFKEELDSTAQTVGRVTSPSSLAGNKAASPTSPPTEIDGQVQEGPATPESEERSEVRDGGA